MGGESAQIIAPVFRNELIAIIGQSNFLSTPEVKGSAFEQMARHALQGELTIELEQVPLDRITDAWTRLQQGVRRKLIVIP